MDELSYRKDLARQLLSEGIGPNDLENHPSAPMLAAAATLASKLNIGFPAGLKPTPHALPLTPALDDPLPKADVVVVTWTIDETMALCDVLTPGITRDHWYRYARNFAAYRPKIRPHAPSVAAGRLGSYYLTTIGAKKVLCFKSELHLNQDGVTAPPLGAPGNATLPVKDLFNQILDETQADLIITTGTAGAVFKDQDLGDVVITRAAKFRLQQEFRDASFNGKTFVSNWNVNTTHFAKAVALMATFKSHIAEPEFLPPTVNFAPTDHLPKPIRENTPSIMRDGDGMPAFHPILTTDYFEFGTSANHLEQIGCAVEMGDAALGLAVDERVAAGKNRPNWLVIRNCSDPQINAALRNQPAKQSQQAMWAVYYYQGFGYWTTVNSAIATWAVIAGL